MSLAKPNGPASLVAAFLVITRGQTKRRLFSFAGAQILSPASRRPSAPKLELERALAEDMRLDGVLT